MVVELAKLLLPRDTRRGRMARTLLRKVNRLVDAVASNRREKIDYINWINRHEPSPAGLEEQRNRVFSYRPLISVIVPTYETEKRLLVEMVESVIAQTYPQWELCIADGASKSPRIKELLDHYARKDQRIKVIYSETNLGIAGNSNLAFTQATGDFVVLLDHDDTLAPFALHEVVDCVNRENEIDFLYSDEDRLSYQGNERLAPFFKPDYSPDLLLSQNYICHMVCIRRSMIERIGGLFRHNFEGSQDYDLFLRASQQTRKIVHLPKVCYHWRITPNSFSIAPETQKKSHASGRRAIEEHLARAFTSHEARVESKEDPLFVYNVRFGLGSSTPLISIIIPTSDKLELLRTSVESILRVTTYPHYEIVILNNRSQYQPTRQWLESMRSNNRRVRVEEADYSFNWSRLNNHGMRAARGEIFVLLNNDTEIITPDWLERLAEDALKPNAGVVGCLLLYPNGRIQHSGVVIGLSGWADHIFKGSAPAHRISPFVSPMVKRNVIAVTGACMAFSRDTKEAIGDFDEDFVVCGSDVEFCMRAFRAGRWNVFDPYVRVVHHESMSREAEVPAGDYSLSILHYGDLRQKGDDFFNPNLSLRSLVPRLRV